MDAIRTQLVFDAGDPHALAAFWADALGYEHEDVDAAVRGILATGHASEDDTVEIDGKRRWRTIASIRHPDDPVRDDGTSLGRRILFQVVPEAKTAKNRVHVDLNVGPDARAEHVERLVGLGATVVREYELPEGRWTAMLDPEGNEFDVQ
jgi:hypothetical protein